MSLQNSQKSPGWLRRRLVDPLRQLLTQGVSPERLALCMALGAVLGCFPVLGTTTLACTLLALWLRLNLPAMQLVNYLMYPLQLILWIPFMRLGERICRAHAEALTAAGVASAFRSGLRPAAHALGSAIGHAVAGWALIAPLACVLAYLSLTPILRRMLRRMRLSAIAE